MITCDICHAGMTHREDSFSIGIDGFREICEVCFKPMEKAVDEREDEQRKERGKMWLKMALDRKNELRDLTP